MPWAIEWYLLWGQICNQYEDSRRQSNSPKELPVTTYVRFSMRGSVIQYATHEKDNKTEKVSVF